MSRGGRTMRPRDHDRLSLFLGLGEAKRFPTEGGKGECG